MKACETTVNAKRQWENSADCKCETTVGKFSRHAKRQWENSADAKTIIRHNTKNFGKIGRQTFFSCILLKSSGG